MTNARVIIRVSIAEIVTTEITVISAVLVKTILIFMSIYYSFLFFLFKGFYHLVIILCTGKQSIT